MHDLISDEDVSDPSDSDDLLLVGDESEADDSLAVQTVALL